ncbi:hypothetical protein IEQ34_026135 [Dendrobium chrysotoxum]|uniref:Protein TAR1 n=1 Tax=Dendrobium chrysotoxum TaxID=161865 RepID=A0AAV7FMC7_DENCH|nr:hypothetical protein IEQ34_026135 [Dendrobium chrysotoxum]
MVRLVFRPYTRVRRTICTSVSLRASTRVSSGFAPLRHSSPSFGSRHACSHSNPSQKIWRTGHSHSASGRDAPPAPIRFPPDNFKHSLTLFSKSFSSFPRGTCSLSVSRLYLALDGIYRPIRAAFPNNPTRRQRLVLRQGSGRTGLSPSPAPLSRGLGPGPSLRTLLQTTIRAAAWQPDSNAGPIPGNPRKFLLLRLLICLNSAGGLACPGVAFKTPSMDRRMVWDHLNNQRDDYPLLSRRAEGHEEPLCTSEPSPAHPSTGGWTRSDVTLDAQADVPLADWPRAQLAFKDSMVRGILQFAPRIAFRCALHRCESRDIHCRESCQSIWRAAAPQATKPI